MPQASQSNMTGLSSLREEIEGALETSLGRLSSETPQRLQDAMAYSLMAGGKRLRPALVLMACEACGGQRADALSAACAMEMVHTYSLIHDDLPAMDDDDLRRGVPTCHKKFDEATAILAGDALLTLAFEIIASDVQPTSVALDCCLDLARAAGPEGMVGGQMADLQAETAGVNSLEQLEAIHRRKTGRLIRASLTLGGRIAGASPAEITALSVYGNAVGLAFQIADDLLDVEGSVDKMGKAVQKDASHQKSTYPSWMGVEASRQRAEQLVDDACRAIAIFEERRLPLEELARFIIARDH
ncbi:MAG: polyprenyl synthetase family protein [Planctomycetaceae bacterium]